MYTQTLSIKMPLHENDNIKKPIKNDVLLLTNNLKQWCLWSFSSIKENLLAQTKDWMDLFIQSYHAEYIFLKDRTNETLSINSLFYV